MRISDWSSDVCSSDLRVPVFVQHRPGIERLESRRTHEGIDAALQRLRDIRLQHDRVCRTDGQAHDCERAACERTNDPAHSLNPSPRRGDPGSIPCQAVSIEVVMSIYSVSPAPSSFCPLWPPGSPRLAWGNNVSFHGCPLT